MGQGGFSAELSEPAFSTHQVTDSPHTLSALRLSRGSPTGVHLLPSNTIQRHPTRRNCFQNCSAESLRWYMRVLRSGGSLAFGQPVSTESIWSRSQLFAYRWKNLFLSLAPGCLLVPVNPLVWIEMLEYG